MIYSAHQISFLPWVGFWNKISKVDCFDVSVYDQFTKHTWQHFSFIGEPEKKTKMGVEVR